MRDPGALSFLILARKRMSFLDTDFGHHRVSYRDRHRVRGNPTDGNRNGNGVAGSRTGRDDRVHLIRTDHPWREARELYAGRSAADQHRRLGRRFSERTCRCGGAGRRCRQILFKALRKNLRRARTLAEKDRRNHQEFQRVLQMALLQHGRATVG